MKANAYQREVMARTKALGASEVSLDPGGKHHRLHFTYGGQSYGATIASSPRNQRNAIFEKMKDIRHMLGIANTKDITQMETKPLNPALPETAVAALLSNNRPEPPDKALTDEPFQREATARGTVAYYTNGCLVFRFPKEIRDCISSDNGFKVLRTGDDAWEIIPGGAASLHKQRGDLYYLRLFARGSKKELAAGFQLFTQTPAEYLAADGHVLVRLISRPDAPRSLEAEAAPDQGPAKSEPERLPQREARSAPMMTEKVEALRPTARPEMAIPEMQNQPSIGSPADSVPTAAEMRATLASLRRIYAQTPYRLKRNSDGAIFLEAPRIE